MRRTIIKYMGSLLLLLLGGCSFHLQGLVNLPPSLKTVYLHSFSPYNNLTKQTRTIFSNYGIRIVDSATQAPLTVDLLSDSVSTTQTSIGGDDQLQNYLVTYTTTFAIRDAKGNDIVESKTVESQRNIQVLKNEIISNSNKLEQAQASLYRDNIEKILFCLSSKDTQRALKPKRTR